MGDESLMRAAAPVWERSVRGGPAGPISLPRIRRGSGTLCLQAVEVALPPPFANNSSGLSSESSDDAAAHVVTVRVPVSDRFAALKAQAARAWERGWRPNAQCVS